MYFEHDPHVSAARIVEDLFLLARALYRRPRLLFMDEGTSHLDTEIEAKVNSAIQTLGLTRIIIAHRPETIKSAQRCLMLSDATVRECPARETARDRQTTTDVNCVTRLVADETVL